MLIDAKNFWKLHRRWALGTAVLTALAVGWTLVAAVGRELLHRAAERNDDDAFAVLGP